MCQEIETVCKDTSFVTYDDTTNLSYLSQVWKETLRLYPPAPGTARETPTDCVIDDVFIPKKSFITVSNYV